MLRLAGLTAEAAELVATAPITDSASARAAQGALNKARKAAYAAGVTAGDAAGVTAGDAARVALRPTVVELQKSALELVDRMIEAQEAA